MTVYVSYLLIVLGDLFIRQSYSCMMPQNPKTGYYIWCKGAMSKRRPTDGPDYVEHLGGLVFLCVENLQFKYVVDKDGLDYYLIEPGFGLSAFIKGIFTRSAWCMTTFISFERCMCITLPLHIKQVLTPNKTVLTQLCIVMVVIAVVTPFIVARPLGTKFVAPLNATMFGLFLTDIGPYIERISFSVILVFQNTCYLLNIIFTGILAVQLNLTSRWRQNVPNATNPECSTTKVSLCQCSVSSIAECSTTKVSLSQCSVSSIAECSTTKVSLSQCSGMDTAVNINVFFLPMADLGGLVFMCVENIQFKYVVDKDGLDYFLNDPGMGLSAFIKGIFVRSSWCMTTFIALERCLCITLPLNIKQVLTIKKTILIQMIIVIINMAVVTPFIAARPLGT
ncbi:hypothetical protein Btru_074438, partial [Bulinus truncatus]